MLIQVPLKRRVLVLEWKAIRIDFLDLGPAGARLDKAKRLNDMRTVKQILDLRFNENDMWRAGQTIRSWLTTGPTKGSDKKSPRKQLAEYLVNREIMKLKEENDIIAGLVVVIGSRQVLYWEMNLRNYQLQKLQLAI
jgi:hypothetical protein